MKTTTKTTTPDYEQMQLLALMPEPQRIAEAHTMSIQPNNHAAIIDGILGIQGKAAELLRTWGTLFRLIQNLDAAKLTNRQKNQLRAAMALRYTQEMEDPIINSPADVAALMMPIETRPTEALYTLCLDRRNKVIHTATIYEGSVNSSQVRIGEVFRPAIIRNASAIIICHNHPSGDPTPSPDDVAVTRAIVHAGKLFDVEVLDHVVIGLNRWVSLKERGLGFA